MEIKFQKDLCLVYKSLLLVMVVLLFSCNKTVLVESRIVKKTAEATSFVTHNTVILTLPVLTKEVNESDSVFNSTEVVEEAISNLYPKLQILPFKNFYREIELEKKVDKTELFFNSYFKNGQIDSSYVSDLLSINIKKRPSHFLLFKVEKFSLWKDLRGATNRTISIRGTLYDVENKKVVFELISAAKAVGSDKKTIADFSDMANLLVVEIVKQLPYDPTRVFVEPSRPDF